MNEGKSSSKTIWIVVGVIAACAVLCCAGGAIFGFMSFDKVISHPDGIEGGMRQMVTDMAGDSHVAAQTFAETFMRDHDVDAAWEQTSSSFQTATKREGFDELHTAIHNAMGDFEEMTIRNYNSKATLGSGQSHELLYDAQFAKGAGTIAITMRGQSGHLLVESVSVNSPLFTKTVTEPATDDHNSSTQSEAPDEPKPDERR